MFDELYYRNVPLGSRVPRGARYKDRLLIILSKTIFPTQFDQGASLASAKRVASIKLAARVIGTCEGEFIERLITNWEGCATLALCLVAVSGSTEIRYIFKVTDTQTAFIQGCYSNFT